MAKLDKGAMENKADKKVQLLKKIINKSDPIGLLDMGTPKDEYESEIRQIAAGLDKCNNENDVTELVYGIFVKMFDEEIAGDKGKYKQIAKIIIKFSTILLTKKSGIGKL
jgi:hypothetical protein